MATYLIKDPDGCWDLTDAQGIVQWIKEDHYTSCGAPDIRGVVEEHDIGTSIVPVRITHATRTLDYDDMIFITANISKYDGSVVESIAYTLDGRA